jgi:hypothetical protein
VILKIVDPINRSLDQVSVIAIFSSVLVHNLTSIEQQLILQLMFRDSLFMIFEILVKTRAQNTPT